MCPEHYSANTRNKFQTYKKAGACKGKIKKVILFYFHFQRKINEADCPEKQVVIILKICTISGKEMKS